MQKNVFLAIFKAIGFLVFIFIHKGKEFNITLSAGIAIYKHDEELFEDTLKRADQMLYKAKDKGRNRIEIQTDWLYVIVCLRYLTILFILGLIIDAICF